MFSKLIRRRFTGVPARGGAAVQPNARRRGSPGVGEALTAAHKPPGLDGDDAESDGRRSRARDGRRRRRSYGFRGEDATDVSKLREVAQRLRLSSRSTPHQTTASEVVGSGRNRGGGGGASSEKNGYSGREREKERN